MIPSTISDFTCRKHSTSESNICSVGVRRTKQTWLQVAMSSSESPTNNQTLHVYCKHLPTVGDSDSCSFSPAAGDTVHIMFTFFSFLSSSFFLPRNTGMVLFPRRSLNGIEEEPPFNSTQTSYTCPLFFLKTCSLSFLLLFPPKLQLLPPFHIFYHFVRLLHCSTNTGERGGFGLGAYWLIGSITLDWLHHAKILFVFCERFPAEQ